MDKAQIEALLAALRLGLEGGAIDKITITVNPQSKPKPTK